jgi:hypothetical protein
MSTCDRIWAGTFRISFITNFLNMEPPEVIMSVVLKGFTRHAQMDNA